MNSDGMEPFLGILKPRLISSVFKIQSAVQRKVLNQIVQLVNFLGRLPVTGLFDFFLKGREKRLE